MSKDWDDYSFNKKRNKLKDYAKTYGIDTDDYNMYNSGRGQFDADDRERPGLRELEKEVTRRSANDYDVRRSMEYAREIGDKSALGSITGISRMDEAHKIQKAIKKRSDEDGSFGSANDYAGVMTGLADEAQAFRDKKINELLDGRLKGLKKKAKSAGQVPGETRQASDRFLQSRQRVAETEDAMVNQEDPTNAEAPDAPQVQASQANELLEKTKRGIADQLQPGTTSFGGF